MADLPLNYDPTTYLEQCSEPWVNYNLKRHQGKEANAEFEALTKDPRIQRLIDDCVTWPDPPLSRHNDAGHPIHKIELLADFGLDTRDEWIKALSNLIIEHHSEDGFFQSKVEIPERWGGKGTSQMMWLLCDTPVLIYALQKFGVDNDYTREATRMLVWLSENNGWHCKGSNPNFRGPGKKDDHCPYANLITLKALSLSEYKETEAVQRGIDSHIMHWENREGKKIYMFGIGSTFKKLKYPNVWFDILHMVDVLSQYPYAREYNEFWEMWGLIRDKQREDGSFIPESVYKAWSEWSFGQKKEPSPWMTYKIYEIANRIK